MLMRVAVGIHGDDIESAIEVNLNVKYFKLNVVISKLNLKERLTVRRIE